MEIAKYKKNTDTQSLIQLNNRLKNIIEICNIEGIEKKCLLAIVNDLQIKYLDENHLYREIETIVKRTMFESGKMVEAEDFGHLIGIFIDDINLHFYNLTIEEISIALHLGVRSDLTNQYTIMSNKLLFDCVNHYKTHKKRSLHIQLNCILEDIKSRELEIKKKNDEHTKKLIETANSIKMLMQYEKTCEIDDTCNFDSMYGILSNLNLLIVTEVDFENRKKKFLAEIIKNKTTKNDNAFSKLSFFDKHEALLMTKKYFILKSIDDSKKSKKSLCQNLLKKMELTSHESLSYLSPNNGLALT